MEKCEEKTLLLTCDVLQAFFLRYMENCNRITAILSVFGGEPEHVTPSPRFANF